jgi:putative hydrolases of HD superfamily
VSALRVLAEAVRLKRLDRSGWKRVDVAHPESVAAHSWGVAWLVLALAPPELDRGRALSYAVLHDLAEVRTGDLTPYDDRTDKTVREHAAFAGLTEGLQRPELLALLEAYEAQADDEARFVRECDRLDMAIQALVYAEEGARTGEFVASAAAVVAHPALRPVLDAIVRRMPA